MRGVRDLRGSVPEESDRDERVNTLFENAARICAAFFCKNLENVKNIMYKNLENVI